MRWAFVILAMLSLIVLGFGCSEDQVSTPGPMQNQSPLDPNVPALTQSIPAPDAFYSFCWGPPPYDFMYGDYSEISKRTGLATHIWYVGLTPEEYVTPIGLAFDLDGTMYTTLNYMDYDPANCWSQLAKLDPATGAVTRIGGRFPMNTSGPEIDACGNLYVLGFDVPHLGYIHGDRYLYRMDKYTGEATAIGYTGDHHEWMDMAFDSKGRLWGTWGNRLYLIDTETGAATLATRIYGVPGDPPPPPYTLIQEVMTIAFDANDVLYASAINVEWDTGHGAPVMTIDTTTGQATLLGYTECGYNHGGDIMPATVRVAHRLGNGTFRCIDISMSALATHLAHGDYVPGTAGHDCNCPDSKTPTTVE